MKNINWIKLLYRILFKNKIFVCFMCLCVSDKKAIKLKNNIFNFNLKFILDILIKYKDYDFIYPPQGFGEICVTGGLLKSYKEQNKSHKVAILCKKNGHFLYANELLEYADVVLKIPNGYNKIINTIDINIYNTKNDGYYDSYKNMKVGLADRLRLKNNYEFKTLDINISKNIENLFKEMNLNKNKTIFINIDYVTFSCNISDLEWVEIAKLLSKKGYDIIFNSSEDNFYGFRTVFLSPKESLEFILLCGNLLSVRTGFCDIVEAHTKDIKSLVLYQDGGNRHTGEKIMRFYSLNDIFNSTNTKEVIVKGFNDANSIINEYFDK